MLFGFFTARARGSLLALLVLAVPAAPAAAAPADGHGKSAKGAQAAIVSPVITSLSSSVGSTGGGELITINGQYLLAANIKFGNVLAVVHRGSVNTDTRITAISPGGPPGIVHITAFSSVTGFASTNTSADEFRFVAPAPAPTVTSVSPARGPLAGGNTVTITGSSFTSGSVVNFGGTLATSSTYVDSTTMTAVAPSGSLGTVDITVTAGGVSSATSTADQYTYSVSAAVTSVTPNRGSVNGGTTVTMGGVGFTGATGVKFGANNGTSVSVSSDTSLTAVSPPGTVGSIDVTVIAPGGTSGTSILDRFTYIGAPTVTALNPTGGRTTGGTTVIITGTGFTAGGTANSVSFDGTAAQFTVNSNTQITASSPSGSGSVNIRVTTPNGGTSAVTAANTYTYGVQPAITSLSPAGGTTAGSTSVTINGTGFMSGGTLTAVKFGGVSAGYSVLSDTRITALSPAGSVGTVDVTVTNANGGTSTVVPAGQYTYVPGPTVTGLSPTKGPAAGGTAVTITGTGFNAGSTVTFAGTAAASVTFTSATSITAVSPPGWVGPADVRVTTDFVRSAIASADVFTYVARPVVTVLDPFAGSTTGGTSVKIVGGPFTGASAVSFGGTAATSFTIEDDSTIKAVVPAGSLGPVGVTVTTVGGTSTTSGDEFEYVAPPPPPSITKISPARGPNGGGTSVVITGTALTGATAVDFGPTSVTVFSVDSPTQITVPAPAGSGTVDVRVKTPGGTSPVSADDQFTYFPPPTVAMIDPITGPLSGGTTVTIFGTEFVPGSAVTFGGVAAASSTVISSTTITAVTPAGTGMANVQVTTPGGTSGGIVPFLYLPAPVVTSIGTTMGPASGGTTVTIAGTGFTADSAVSFGATTAASVTFISGTSLTAVSPGGTGTVDVRVTTPGGTSADGVTDQFTYVDAPTVTSVDPAFGSTTGPTSVKIIGTGFRNVTAVTFGSTQAHFIVNNDTKITAPVPPGPAGTVDVRVTTTGGTSATSTADQFTYVTPPTVAMLSATSGGTAGGTSVTITGTGFTAPLNVTFGGTTATSFTIDNATSITAVTPAMPPGTVDVQVTNGGGSSPTGNAGRFTFVTPPAVASLNPAGGSTAGGTSVTIVGSDFNGATAVSFGGTAATMFHVDSGTEITVTAPAHAAGAVDVRVTTAGGTSAIVGGDEFTYAVPNQPPSFTSASSQTVVAGQGLAAVTANDPDGDPLTYSRTGGTLPDGITLNGDGTFAGTATTPDMYMATIEVADGRGGTASAQLTVQVAVPVPAVTAVSPAGGGTAGGTSVVIAGTWLSDATAVMFGTRAATSYTVDGRTRITAVAPAAPPGAVDVTVTTGAGTSALRAADRYTYTAPAPANQAPAFTAAAANTSQSVTAGAALTALAATDPDNDPLTFTLTAGGLPDGITLAGDGSFAGIATTAGESTANITVADGRGGTATTRLAVIVTAAVSSTGQGTTPQSTDVTVPAGGSVSLVDGGEPADTVTIDGQGTYTLDPDTGVITFEPVLGFAGNAQPITFTVTDADGNAVTSHYTAHVTAPPPPVTVPRATSGAARQSTTIALPEGGTVMLLDANGHPATEVSVPDVGTYRVVTPSAALMSVAAFHTAAATEPAVITFTPVAGYTGTAPAVTFQVTDAYGQKVTAEYTPTVTVEAGPLPKPIRKPPTSPTRPAVLPVTGPDALGTAALGLLLVAAGLIAVSRRRLPGARRR
ncbi:phospholipase [Actinoplanes sp. TBRC 11911]|uniref:IPT/TIG domain-containing protein n=1 Tax=Actinoplanes sp. TBRC 11911 TaxID=2729386 RepID=UPI00145D1282|nr:IPT/TIG domain-containing protein [Actinoplanes sp. TBRC 11911]NMO52413.1 phospholipase [Actinoplanes sp. TBRC 11911]